MVIRYPLLFFIEFVFGLDIGTGACTLRHGASLQELRCVLPRLARASLRAFGRVASDFGL
jgi:hypothetical protein